MTSDVTGSGSQRDSRPPSFAHLSRARRRPLLSSPCTPLPPPRAWRARRAHARSWCVVERSDSASSSSSLSVGWSVAARHRAAACCAATRPEGTSCAIYTATLPHAVSSISSPLLSLSRKNESDEKGGDEEKELFPSPAKQLSGSFDGLGGPSMREPSTGRGGAGEAAGPNIVVIKMTKMAYSALVSRGRRHRRAACRLEGRFLFLFKEECPLLTLPACALDVAVAARKARRGTRRVVRVAMSSPARALSLTPLSSSTCVGGTRGAAAVAAAVRVGRVVVSRCVSRRRRTSRFWRWSARLSSSRCSR